MDYPRDNPVYVPESERMRFQHRNPARLDPLDNEPPAAANQRASHLRSSGDLPPLRDPAERRPSGRPARRLDL